MIAVAVIALPAIAPADDGQPPKQRPPIIALFERFDANNDWVLTADEVPPPLRERLKRADANDDKKVSLEELVAARKKRGGPPKGEQRMLRMGGPGMGMMERGPKGGPPGKGPKRPDPQKIFMHFDKNKDKQLSVEEFTEGMKRLRRHGPPHVRKGPPRGEHRVLVGPIGPGGPPEKGKMILRQLGPGGPPEKGKMILRQLRPGGPPEKGKMILRYVGRDKPPAGKHPHRPSMHHGRHGHHGPIPPGAVLMRVMDANHDGSISTHEIATCGARLLRLDRDHDGTITKREMVGAAHHRLMAMKRGHKPGPPGPKAEAYKRSRAIVRHLMKLDKDHDGKLSREEAPERLKKRFSQIDADADGKLTLKELRDAWIHIKKHAKAHKPKM
jgi:Ca2+-binding EF-hand superfamily protein